MREEPWEWNDGGLGQRNGVLLEENLGKNIFQGTLFFPQSRKTVCSFNGNFCFLKVPKPLDTFKYTSECYEYTKKYIKNFMDLN